MKWGIFSVVFLTVFLFFMPARATAPGPGHAVVSYTLTTDVKGERRMFVGAEGKIKGVVNPDLFVNEWDVVEITLINGDNLNHHIAIPDFHIMSDTIVEKGKKTKVTVVPFKKGGFVYHCLLENHRKLGMEGKMVVVGK
ncbi:MAG TPA: cupredoxin domain-containing protein [Candidatus Manganitrophaceae bacterium]|nr:cupredoxin domain-containing protein [Candidatus Manganitrophaceae bacterium]